MHSWPTETLHVNKALLTENVQSLQLSTLKNPCIALKNISALMSVYAQNGIRKLLTQERKLDQPNTNLVPYRFAKKPPGICVIQYSQ